MQHQEPPVTAEHTQACADYVVVRHPDPGDQQLLHVVYLAVQEGCGAHWLAVVGEDDDWLLTGRICC